jgi:hypothetical protein
LAIVPYLRVSDKDDLSVRALLVVGCDGLDNSCGSLKCRVVVADATAGGSSSTCRVDDGFRAGSGVSGGNLVYKTTCGTEAIVLGDSRLACAEDVDFGAVLPLGELNGGGNGQADEGKSCSGCDLHCGRWFIRVEVCEV